MADRQNQSKIQRPIRRLVTKKLSKQEKPKAREAPKPFPKTPHPLSSRAKSRDLAFSDANHAASRHSHKTQVTPMPTPTKPQPRRGERKQPRTKSRTPARTQS